MNGIVIVNKPKGCTSHDVVREVKKIFNEKVGHTGTLDPMATGVLPLLIGKGTLCSKYLINHDKTYHVILEFGKKTDTADIEGNIIEEKEVSSKIMDKENIKDALKSFIGKQQQKAPMYSAIKFKGKKLYEYARKGIQIEVKPRKIEIYKIDLLNINNENKQIEFIVSCSKGTYIRSLCEDIADKLGTIGYMAELERQSVGSFTIENSLTLEQLRESKTIQISIEEFFNNKNKINLNERQLELFLNGVKLTQKNRPDGVYRIYLDDKFIGTGILQANLLKRDIII